MTLNICEKISQTMGELFTYSSVNEFVRISTPFILPDGSLIDLFLKEKEESYVLTDLGETFGWLYLQTSAFGLSENQEIIIKDILITHGIEQLNGMLVIRLKQDDNLSDAVLHLVQAIIRIADTNNEPNTSSFKPIIEPIFNRIIEINSQTKILASKPIIEPIKEQLEEFLNNKNLNIERDKKFPGFSGTSRNVDFCIYQTTGNTLINVLGIQGKPRLRAEKLFITWSEISYLKENKYNFISLVDDSKNFKDEKSIKLLSKVSDVVKWSNRNYLQKLLE
jgi:hypothetical protein